LDVHLLMTLVVFDVDSIVMGLPASAAFEAVFCRVLIVNCDWLGTP
jgi:hypothetical protein